MGQRHLIQKPFYLDKLLPGQLGFQALYVLRNFPVDLSVLGIRRNHRFRRIESAAPKIFQNHGASSNGTASSCPSIITKVSGCQNRWVNTCSSSGLRDPKSSSVSPTTKNVPAMMS